MPGLSLPTYLPTYQQAGVYWGVSFQGEIIRGPSALKARTGWSQLSQAFSSRHLALLPCWATLTITAPLLQGCIPRICGLWAPFTTGDRREGKQSLSPMDSAQNVTNVALSTQGCPVPALVEAGQLPYPEQRLGRYRNPCPLGLN